MTAAHLLVDDHLLLRILLEDRPSGWRSDAPVSTTGLWYHRLGRALAGTTVSAALSRQVGGSDATLGRRVIAAATALPDAIGLVSLRDLAWPMAELVESGLRLNLLSLEALAAAEHLGAVICLAEQDENPPLLAAARERGVPTRLV